MFKSLRHKTLALLISSQQSSSAPDAVLQQVRSFETALQAMDLLLDDRGKEGTTLLRTEHNRHKLQYKDPAAVYPLALGVMEFIEATLGFEKEVMARAHHTLSAAENALLAHSKYNQKHNIATSHIYPPGTEFQVTYAELTLLNALVMLLQENNSMMEQAKALLKLRKAYQILDATFKKIKELEPVFNRNLAKFTLQAQSHSVSSVDLPGFQMPEAEQDSEPDVKRLLQNMESIYQMRKSRLDGTNISDNVNLFSESTLSFASVHRNSYAPSDRSLKDLLRPTVASLASASRLRPGSFRGSAELPRSTPTPCGGVDVTPASDADEDESDDESDDEFSDACEEIPTDDGAQFLPSELGSSVKLGVYTESMVSMSSFGSSTNESHLHVSTIDEFIHSGVQLCFGILQVVLSLIPPTIGKVLSIVGFKGDRDVGLRMLWRTAITARNIHGELALIFLLEFYDGPMQFVDTSFQLQDHDATEQEQISLVDRSTITDEELTTIIKDGNSYTPQLMKKARLRFPHNGLWVLQEGRMLSGQGELMNALEIMQQFTDSPSCHVEMPQIEALLVFDRAMLYAFAHDFDNAARDFHHMLKVSTWSLAVCLFMTGGCYLERWRQVKMGVLDLGVEKAKMLAYYAEKAEHFLKLAPTYVPDYGHNASKKGGIGGAGKQMPFDKFVIRKTKQIEARCKAHRGLLYIECVGTSVILELIYFWKGYNKMPVAQLQAAKQMLGYSAGPHAKIPEEKDERMIRCFIEAVILRELGNAKESLALLDTEVISKYVTLDNPFKFHKMTYAPYLYPTAFYEKALTVWSMTSGHDSKRAVAECAQWLKKAETVSDIGDYELSNRTSMRIKAAQERLAQVSAAFD